MTRLSATVHGHVHGVGFRWYVVRRAARLGLTGWVGNDPEGTVQVVAEGPAEALDELSSILAHGPGGARVDRVDEHRGPASGAFRSFTVRASAHGGD